MLFPFFLGPTSKPKFVDGTQDGVGYRSFAAAFSKQQVEQAEAELDGVEEEAKEQMCAHKQTVKAGPMSKYMEAGMRTRRIVHDVFFTCFTMS